MTDRTGPSPPPPYDPIDDPSPWGRETEPTENTCLLPHRDNIQVKRWFRSPFGSAKSFLLISSMLLIPFAIGGSVGMLLCKYELATPEKIKLRYKLWEQEAQEHQQMKAKWATEERRLEEDYEQSKASWFQKEDQLRESYEQSKIAWMKKEGDLREDYERSKVAWKRKEDQLSEDYERSKVAWTEKEGELRDHYERLRNELIRKEQVLRAEIERLNSTWSIEQKKYAQDRARWEAERKEEEQRRKEYERIRFATSWDAPFGHQCSSYGTRPYNAKLMNVPPGVNALEVCAEMPITFHGKTIKRPLRCERLWNGEVHGHWMVDFDEPLCQPYWANPEDKGCVGHNSGVHRWEARLWNIHSGKSWSNMCSSTPNTINGYHFRTPTHCEDRGTFHGVVGMFEVPDINCS